MVTEITWTSVGGKLWVNVRSCCVNKTHCFSLPAEATHEYNCRLFFFFISTENSPFFKKKTKQTWVLYLEFRLPPSMIILHSLGRL